MMNKAQKCPGALYQILISATPAHSSIISLPQHQPGAASVTKRKSIKDRHGSSS